MAGRFKVYLAGPERLVIRGPEITLRKEALCATHGVECLLLDDSTHLDDSILKGGSPEAGVIYAKCLAVMLRADFGIFNLTPVGGTVPDASTVFRLGMMAAMGKPVYAYLNQEDDVLERSVALSEAMNNSIIASCLAMQNRMVVRTAVAAKNRFSDLRGLESCLAAAKREFAEAANDSRFAVGFV